MWDILIWKRSSINSTSKKSRSTWGHHLKPIPAPQHTYMSERKRKDRFMRLLVTQLTVLSTVYCLTVSHKGDAEYRICTASDYLLKLCKAFFFLLLLQILITHRNATPKPCYTCVSTDLKNPTKFENIGTPKLEPLQRNLKSRCDGIRYHSSIGHRKFDESLDSHF